MAEPKYKVGDRVRIMSSPPSNWEAWPFWVAAMSTFCGKEGTISGTYKSTSTGNPGYYIKDMDRPHFTWLESWLEPGEPKKPYEDIINKSKKLETKFLNRKG